MTAWHYTHERIEKLRRKMKRNRVTQVELARRSGFCQPHVSDIITGKVDNPGSHTLDVLYDHAGPK